MASLTPRIDRLDSYQNIAINGNFDIWQRGAGPSVSVNNANFFLADRWRVQNTATSNVQVERSTDVPTFAQSGFASLYSMKLTNSATPTSPTTNYVNIRHTLEGHDYAALHGRPFRVQFWVKSSIAGVYCVALKNNDGTRGLIKEITINAVNVWEQKVIDVTGDTSGTWLFDHQAGLRLLLNLQVPVANRSNSYTDWANDTNTFFATTNQVGWNVTASSTFFIAQFMIVHGSFDSNAEIPFAKASKTIADELALCQRYYERSLGGGTVMVTTQTRNDNGGTKTTSWIPFAVEKRIAPTMTGNWTEMVGGYPVRTPTYAAYTRGFYMDFGTGAGANPMNGDYVADVEL